MKRIQYASGTFLTEDAVADALMDYASVLAIVGSADVVELPGIDDREAIRTIQLLVGPASQIMSWSSDHPEVDLVSHAATDELRRRAELRLPSSRDVADSGTRESESDAESTEH